MNEHKELLEAAAKAAGLKDARWDDFYSCVSITGDNGLKDCPWNPTTSLHELYDLARRCKLTIHFETGEVIPPAIDGCYTRYEFDIGDDLEEALAILRAAAATGETK